MSINIPFAQNSSGSGSPWLVPVMPTPLTGFTFIPTTLDTIPHKGTLIDNVQFPDNSTGSLIGKLGTSAIWTVVRTDIHANVDGFVGAGRAVWYDDVNDRLYIWGLDTGTTPDTLYTSYVTLETGTLTSVGSVQLSTDVSLLTTENQVLIQRPAVDSGNFTLQCKDRVIVINSSTGAEVSNVSAVSITPGTFSTQDGSTFLGIITAQEHRNMAELVKNRVATVIPMPTSAVGGDSLGGHQISYLRWGSEVRALSSSANKVVFRALPLTEFETWVKKLASLGGLA